MNDISKKYDIISAGLIQREKLLSKLIKEKSNYENLSDAGWFLTLGSEPLGMLSAVAANKEARKLNEIIRNLETEIDILKETKISLLSKL